MKSVNSLQISCRSAQLKQQCVKRLEEIHGCLTDLFTSGVACRFNTSVNLITELLHMLLRRDRTHKSASARLNENLK